MVPPNRMSTGRAARSSAVATRASVCGSANRSPAFMNTTNSPRASLRPWFIASYTPRSGPLWSVAIRPACAPDRLQRAVGRAAVDDDPLEIRVGLPQDAAGGRGESGPIVQNHGDHADPKRHAPTYSFLSDRLISLYVKYVHALLASRGRRVGVAGSGPILVELRRGRIALRLIPARPSPIASSHVRQVRPAHRSFRRPLAGARARLAQPARPGAALRRAGRPVLQDRAPRPPRRERQATAGAAGRGPPAAARPGHPWNSRAGRVARDADPFGPGHQAHRRPAAQPARPRLAAAALADAPTGPPGGPPGPARGQP